MIILGIDPGYATVGFGVIETIKSDSKVLEYGAIITKKEESLPVRLARISNAISILMDKYKPDAVAVEELFFQNNQKTAITVAEARGVILLTAFLKCKNVFEYTPLQIKQAMTGYGRADKRQIQSMVKLYLKLDKIPKPDDAADALAVALTHAQTRRFCGMFNV